MEALRRVVAMIRAGDHLTAFESARKILKRRPNDAKAHQLAATAAAASRRRDEAMFHAERAIAIDPNGADQHALLGGLLVSRGEHAKAITHLERALKLQPGNPHPLAALSTAYERVGRHADAEAALRKACDAAPGATVLHANLALIELNTGRAAEAVDRMRAIVDRRPNDVIANERLTYALNYDDRATPAERASAHKRFGGLLESACAPLEGIAPADDPERPLRIALIGPDFRSHSVAYFVRPILEHLDRDRFTPIGVMTGVRTDAMTDLLRGLAAEWHDAPNMTDSELAAMIRGERIDVAVDLTGLASTHRLATFARRPAPVQITYCGYANTTGLTRIDARLVDAVTDPDGSDDLATERLVRIDPCFLCYSPPADAPEPRRDAADRPIRFGSFNNAAKISPSCLGAWLRVLAGVPESTMLLKSRGFESEAARARVVEACERLGVDPSRIEMRAWTATAAEHLELYSTVDIALDTFPYNGTTTTCEAMWMGVPTVTVEGDHHAARVGASLLRVVGLDDLVAPDVDGFVARAVELAGDRDRLGRERSTLRGRMAVSALMDGVGLTRRFESACRSLWRDACAADNDEGG